MLDTSSRVGRRRRHGGSERTITRAEHVGDVVSPETRTQWTVKGIDKQTLEMSRLAARKRGMRFGAWVNQALREAASEETSFARIVPDELMAKIAEIDFKIDQSVGELKQQASNIQHDVRVLQMLVPKAG
jgi:hypothetical protein